MAALPSPVASLRPSLKPKLFEDPIKKADLLKVRYVFSPRLTLDVQNEKCDLDFIEPQRITLIDNYPYPDRDTSMTAHSESYDGPGWKLYQRAAGHIVAGLLNENRVDGQVETGFCELTALTGVNPEVHAEMLEDLQFTILPEPHETGESMLNWLKSDTVVTAIARKPNSVRRYYEETYEQVLWSAEQSIRHAAHRKEEILTSVAQAALNKQGFSSRIGAAENGAFLWLGLEPPKIINPAVQAGTDFKDLTKAIQLIVSNLPTQPAQPGIDVAELVGATIQGLQARGLLVIPNGEKSEENTKKRRTLEDKQKEARARNGADEAE